MTVPALTLLIPREYPTTGDPVCLLTNSAEDSGECLAIMKATKRIVDAFALRTISEVTMAWKLAALRHFGPC